MSVATSNDLRIRIIAAWKTKKYTWEQLAELFGVGRATVDRLIVRYRKTGSIEPLPRGGNVPPLITEHDLPVMESILRAHADATLAELAAMYTKRTGVKIGPMVAHRAAVRLGFTRKKRVWSPPSKPGLQSKRVARRSSRS